MLFPYMLLLNWRYENLFEEDNHDSPKTSRTQLSMTKYQWFHRKGACNCKLGTEDGRKIWKKKTFWRESNKNEADFKTLKLNYELSSNLKKFFLEDAAEDYAKRWWTLINWKESRNCWKKIQMTDFRNILRSQALTENAKIKKMLIRKLTKFID